MSIKFTTYFQQAHIQNCYLCKQSSQQFICSTCEIAFPRVECKRNCGNLLNRPDIQNALGQVEFDALICPYEFRWPIDKLIKDFKFNKRDHLSQTLSKHLLNTLQQRLALFPRPDAILPVPTHWKRYWFRGFNQAHAIASPLSKSLNIPIRSDLCKRVQFSTTQVNSSGNQRRENLKSAFQAGECCGVSRIAIVDDVVTTGSTANAVIRALKTQYPHLSFEMWALAISSANLD